MQPVPRTEHFGSFVTLRSPWGHHRAFSNAFNLWPKVQSRAMSAAHCRDSSCSSCVASGRIAWLSSFRIKQEKRTKYAKAASANINQRHKPKKSHVWRLAWKLGLQPCVKKRMHTLNNPTLGLEIIGSSLETRLRLGHLNPQMETSSEIASMVVMTKQC